MNEYYFLMSLHFEFRVYFTDFVARNSLFTDLAKEMTQSCLVSHNAASKGAAPLSLRKVRHVTK